MSKQVFCCCILSGSCIPLIKRINEKELSKPESSQYVFIVPVSLSFWLLTGYILFDLGIHFLPLPSPGSTANFRIRPIWKSLDHHKVHNTRGGNDQINWGKSLMAPHVTSHFTRRLLLTPSKWQYLSIYQLPVFIKAWATTSEVLSLLEGNKSYQPREPWHWEYILEVHRYTLGPFFSLYYLVYLSVWKTSPIWSLCLIYTHV